MKNKDKHFMEAAIKQAILAKKMGRPAIGAVVVKKDKVISKAHNQKDDMKDPTAHAEILAIQKAGKKIGPNLDGCSLYVTLKPCLMCLSACYWAHIGKVYYGVGRSGGKKYFVTKKDLSNVVIKNLVLRRMMIKGGLFKNECQRLLS